MNACSEPSTFISHVAPSSAFLHLSGVSDVAARWDREDLSRVCRSPANSCDEDTAEQGRHFVCYFSRVYTVTTCLRIQPVGSMYSGVFVFFF